MIAIKDYKDVIIKAAWEAESRYVSVDKKYFNEIVPELMFYLTYDGIRDKQRTREVFVEYLFPGMPEDLIMFVCVYPRELVCGKSSILLIKDGEWVYD